MTEDQILFSLAEICGSTGLGRTTIYSEINSGRLKTVKVGRRTLVTRPAREAWLQQLEADAPQLETDNAAPPRAGSD